MHTAQIEKMAADEAAEAAAGVSSSNYSSETDAEEPAEQTGGSLASDAQLAALREKLSGNA